MNANITKIQLILKFKYDLKGHIRQLLCYLEVT